MARQRRAAVLMLTVSLALLLGAGSASAAPRAAESKAQKSTGGEVTKTGWWWVANQPPKEAETGLAAYPQPTPPNIPSGSLPVAATAGEPDKVSAVELRLDAKPGALAQTAELVLQESASPGASANAETAKIIACPVTEGFWADGSAARWEAKPEYDCDLAQSSGVRDAKGRWTFDLTSLASLWLGETPTSSSFVLVEAVDAPESFQVTFDGLAANGIGFDATYIPAPKMPSGGPGGLSGATGSAGSSGSSLGGTSSGGSSLSSGSVASGSLAPADAAPVDSDAGTVATTDPVTAETTPVAAPAVMQPWYAGVPKGGLLLVPFALALAYLAMLALGPDAQPAASSSRHGVSRALERLRTAGVRR